MSRSRRPHAFTEDSDLGSRTGPRRRDSDWGGHPRTDGEDLAWAAKRAAVNMAAATIHAQDGGTGSHSDDVVHLCDAIAEELGVYGHERAELLAAAQLHDIGKVSIPREVLEKAAPLDEVEWALMRQHTVVGEQIVGSVPELREVGRLVRHSHERWDGAGYPDRLSGEDIPLGSRIVFCADAFHAIRSDRPYRRGRSARAAMEEVKRNAESQFDPEVADALVKSAGRLRSSGHGGAKGVKTTLRSRRLLALLLTLAIGGSALAAGGSHLLPGKGDKGREQVSPVSGAVRVPGDDVGAPKRAPRVAATRSNRSRARTRAAVEDPPSVTRKPGHRRGPNDALRRRRATGLSRPRPRRRGSLAS